MLITARLILPALIPSWRFFKTVAPSPRVEIRRGEGTWYELPMQGKGLSLIACFCRLLWNPDWNDRLFVTTCAERLVESGDPYFEQEILRRVAGYVPNGVRYQVRLVFVMREGGRLERQELYRSGMRCS